MGGVPETKLCETIQRDADEDRDRDRDRDAARLLGTLRLRSREEPEDVSESELESEEELESESEPELLLELGLLDPIEAPEKKDYGDLDIIVAHPRQKQELAADNINASPDIVQAALGARHSIFMGGYRTSNYAVPIAPGQWATLGCGSKEEECRLQLKLDLLAIRDEEDGEEIEKDGELYYQVDVHFCPDEAEWKRNVFFNSHGDMGMILGVIIRNHGLHLGVHGLKVCGSSNQLILRPTKAFADARPTE
ncbi:hypothetical protein IMY05_C4347000300 [Salix suchowensis]|nr:hypothetical protein IMY05_C4347000300 [Salix suchowensis]